MLIFYCQPCNALIADEHLRRKQISLSFGLTETQTGPHWTPPSALDCSQNKQKSEFHYESMQFAVYSRVLEFRPSEIKGFQVGFEFSGPVGIPVLHFNARRSGSAHSSAKDDAPREVPH